MNNDLEKRSIICYMIKRWANLFILLYNRTYIRMHIKNIYILGMKNDFVFREIIIVDFDIIT